MSLLSFQCRHRYPGGFQLDVAFEMDHGVTSLFGPSGSGKTSLIRVLLRMYPYQSGRVFLDGQEITRLSSMRQPHKNKCIRLYGGQHFAF